ncbi:MAG: hypothetical protein DLM58_16315 [Pseudonocardiales bacterium]|nr:MAG: hypothetical protein DLM58_16315 [Pseudonocardiales bacterium]
MVSRSPTRSGTRVFATVDGEFVPVIEVPVGVLAGERLSLDTRPVGLAVDAPVGCWWVARLAHYDADLLRHG